MSGVTARARRSFGVIMNEVHSNKRWLQLILGEVMSLSPWMQYSTSGQTFSGTKVVSHTVCSSVTAYYLFHTRTLSHTIPCQPQELLLWLPLTHSTKGGSCLTWRCSDTSPTNVAECDENRDIPDLFCILKQEW